MKFASYTLKTNGQVIKSDTGVLANEWAVNGPISSLGAAYEARATVTSTDGATPVGVFGQWLSLENDVTWTATSEGETGEIFIDVEIREAVSQTLMTSAQIILGDSMALSGEYAWSMNIPADFYYSANFSSRMQLASAVSLPVGSTVSFTLYTEADLPAGTRPLVSSSVGAGNTFYIGGGTVLGNISFQNCTVTIDGVAVADDTPQIFINDKYEIVATITAATDLEFCLTNGTNDLASPIGINNLVVNDTVNTYNWPMNNAPLSVMPESNFGGNDLTINTAFVSSSWLDAAFELNNNTLSPRATLARTGGGNFDIVRAQQPSIRLDGAGTAIQYFNTTRYQLLRTSIAYQNGFTIEGLIKVDSNQSALGNIVGNFINSINNISNETLWVLRFDNFDGGPVRPTFTLVGRGTVYNNQSSYGNVVAEVRGSETQVLGQVYHMLATIRPSDNTIEFWLNGVSQGTDTIPTSWYGTLAADSVLDGTQDTYINSGPGFLSGAWRNVTCTTQNIRIHLVEADQSFAETQYNANLPA